MPENGSAPERIASSAGADRYWLRIRSRSPWTLWKVKSTNQEQPPRTREPCLHVQENPETMWWSVSPVGGQVKGDIIRERPQDQGIREV